MKINKIYKILIVATAITVGLSSLYLFQDARSIQETTNIITQQNNIADLSARLEQLKQQLNLSESYSGSGESFQTANDNVNNEVDALAKKLDDLRDEMHALLADKSQSDFPAVSELTQEQRDVLMEEKQANTMTLYVDTMYSEDIDADWSYQTETKTRDALAVVSDKVITREIECRTSICRLEMQKADGATNDEALEAFDTNIDWAGEMRLTYDPNTGEGVVYMAREGHSLPRLAN